MTKGNGLGASDYSDQSDLKEHSSSGDKQGGAQAGVQRAERGKEREKERGKEPEKICALAADAPRVLLRHPLSEDGAAVHRLVGNCPPLDTNSLYCNLLQASHFSATSVAAELRGEGLERELVGFVSGYLIPARADTLFIWQVAVAPAGRGLGLAGRMLREILARPACRQVRHLETTITADNDASWALFRSLARALGANCRESLMFDRERHFGGRHASEMLLHIGPFAAASASSDA